MTRLQCVSLTWFRGRWHTTTVRLANTISSARRLCRLCDPWCASASNPTAVEAFSVVSAVASYKTLKRRL